MWTNANYKGLNESFVKLYKDVKFKKKVHVNDLKQ